MKKNVCFAVVRYLHLWKFKTPTWNVKKLTKM